MGPVLLPDYIRGLKKFLSQELSPYPGRVNALLRYLLSCSIIIVISMTLQVPFISLSLIMVFFVTQANSVITRLAALMLTLCATLGIGIAILVLKFTIEYPLLRLLTSSTIFIIGMFLMRATRLGTLFYIIALMTIFVQSIVDQSANPEVIVRLCLWAWVAACYGILVTLLVNTFLLPNEPDRILETEILHQLQYVDTILAQQLNLTHSSPLQTSHELQQGTLTLHKLLKLSTLQKQKDLIAQSEKLALITTIDRLFISSAGLPAPKNTDPNIAEREALKWLRQACQELSNATRSKHAFKLPPDNSSADPAWTKRVDLQAMRSAFQILADMSPPTAVAPAPREPLLLPDAFSNPDYPRFALKTYLATMLCYVFYTSVQWPGIHTALITCIVIALPSLGASTHRSVLRVVGCIVGSLLALAATLWIVPYIDSIVGLLLMSLPVIAVGAWIAAGSERSSYAGVQIMFAFALSLFSSFAPSTDLTEIRDRVMGILLGVMVSAVVHSLLWPEREGKRLKQSLADLLRSLANLCRAQSARAPTPSGQQQRLQSWELLEQCATMQARVALEPDWAVGDCEQLTLKTQSVLAQARKILSSMSQLQIILETRQEPLPSALLSPLFAWQEQLADELNRLAEYLTDARTSRAPELSLRVVREVCCTFNSETSTALLAAAQELKNQVNGMDLLIKQT